MTKQDATQNFRQADEAWSRELTRVFGPKEAGTARYQKRGQGDAGSELRRIAEWRTDAMQTWQKIVIGRP